MSKIDKIILHDSTRGMDKLYKKYKTPFYKNAAKKFYSLKRGVVFIYTGFWVNGMSETDGPVGAYFLYKAMKKLGFYPIILCDRYCEDFFEDCAYMYIEKGEDSKKNFKKLLDFHKPVAHFSIERCGRDKKGKYKNSAGKNIGKYTSKLDTLFMLANTPTFGVGDGGNEIGMGNFKKFLKRSLKVNPTCVSSDFPIVASVSNWGGYGFIAYLEIYSGKNLLPSFKKVKNYLKYIVKKGSTEGFSGENIMSVDGKGYKIDKKILAKLKKQTNKRK